MSSLPRAYLINILKCDHAGFSLLAECGVHRTQSVQIALSLVRQNGNALEKCDIGLK